MASGALKAVRAYDEHPIEVDYADGVWIRAADGKQYIDGCSGTFNVGLGYGHPVIVESLVSVIKRGFLHGSGSLTTQIIGDAERDLISIAPSILNRCHLKGCTGGSTAVEQAIRHLWAFTGKRGLIAFRNGHHGQTVLTSAVSGMDFRKKRIPVPDNFGQVDFPDCYRCPFQLNPQSCKVECADLTLKQVDELACKGDIAGVIAEPIQGAGGGIIPHKLYWGKISKGLKSRGLLLVMDEVQTFGRAGGFFASSLLNAEPDMIVLAKSISGIGIPASGALLLNEKYCILEAGERSFTWGGSSLAAAGIAATISVMKSPDFFENVVRKGEYLCSKLKDLEEKHRWVGCVRSMGLMSGIEIVESKSSRIADPERTSKIIEECKNHGLLVKQSQYGRGSFVKIRPSMLISYDEIDRLTECLDLAISKAN